MRCDQLSLQCNFESFTVFDEKLDEAGNTWCKSEITFIAILSQDRKMLDSGSTGRNNFD